MNKLLTELFEHLLTKKKKICKRKGVDSPNRSESLIVETIAATHQSHFYFLFYCINFSDWKNGRVCSTIFR